MWDYTKLRIKIMTAGMTQTEFRNKIGFSSVVLAKINKKQKVDMDVLQKICTYFNCDIGDIVSFKGVKQ